MIKNLKNVSSVPEGAIRASGVGGGAVGAGALWRMSSGQSRCWRTVRLQRRACMTGMELSDELGSGARRGLGQVRRMRLSLRPDDVDERTV